MDVWKPPVYWMKCPALSVLSGKEASEQGQKIQMGPVLLALTRSFRFGATCTSLIFSGASIQLRSMENSDFFTKPFFRLLSLVLFDILNEKAGTEILPPR